MKTVSRGDAYREVRFMLKFRGAANIVQLAKAQTELNGRSFHYDRILSLDWGGSANHADDSLTTRPKRAAADGPWCGGRYTVRDGSLTGELQVREE